MKTSKKILIITASLLTTAFISAGLSFGIQFLISGAFWPLFWMFFCGQILFFLLYDRFYESRKMLSFVKEYAEKPYKKYIIPLNCGHCGFKNETEIDLADTEFTCQNCKKQNGIHVNLFAAAITEPISDS